ncbi:unnamed protein product [Camellia sinensis]
MRTKKRFGFIFVLCKPVRERAKRGKEAISAQEQGKIREEKLGQTKESEGNQLDSLRLKFKVGI